MIRRVSRSVTRRNNRLGPQSFLQYLRKKDFGRVLELQHDIERSWEYPVKLGCILNEQRKEKQFCDVVIKMGGKSFSAHKSVLASASESYFKAMFNSSFKEGFENEIKIEGNPDIFEVLLNFIYTGKLKITSETAYEVLEMACYMQVTDLLPVFCKYLRLWLHLGLEEVSLDDIFQMIVLARRVMPSINNPNHILNLIEDCYQFLEQHLTELRMEPVFLEHGHVSFLKEFLSRSEDWCDVENEILDLVIAWLKYDWANRQTEAHNLLQRIRIPLMNVSQNLTGKIGKDVLSIPECQQLIDSVVKPKASKAARRGVRKVCAPILASSYQDGNRRLSCSFRYFDEKTVQWKLLKSMASLPSQSCKYQSLIVVDGRLYALGGYDEEVVLSSHEDSDSEDWNRNRYTDMNPRNLSRADGEKLHSFQHELDGMSCRFNHWQNFGFYSCNQNTWKQLAPMNKGRYNCQLVALEGCIYSIGGTSRHGDAKSDVECYDIETNTWTVLPSLPEDYRWVSSIVFNGSILALGRLCVDKTSDTHSRNYVLYVFYPETKTWKLAIEEEYPSSASVEEYPPSTSGEPNTSTNITKPRKPALLIHNDTCYRVLYPSGHGGQKRQSRPSVKALKWTSDVTWDKPATYGDEIPQNLIGANELGAFQVDGEVFVNDRGFLYRTDVKIMPGQDGEVNLNDWKNFDPQLGLHTNVVWFEFHKKYMQA